MNKINRNTEMSGYTEFIENEWKIAENMKVMIDTNWQNKTGVEENDEMGRVSARQENVNGNHAVCVAPF